jgi:hypothetical protein
MYQSFGVRNFRCFRNLRLTGLNRTNLIAGKNNTGKTAILEALFVHGGAYNPELTLRINNFRGIKGIYVELRREVESPWDLIFNNLDTSKTIELSGVLEGKTSARNGRRIIRMRVIREPEELMEIEKDIARYLGESRKARLSSEAIHVLQFQCKEKDSTQSYYMIFGLEEMRIVPIPPPGPFPVIFLPPLIGRPSLDEDVERFGNLEIARQKNLLVEALQVIEKRLIDLTVIVKGRGPNARPIIHGDLGGGRLLPLQVLGAGMVRLASLVLAIGNAQNGVVLVDEIENGLHHSVLPRVWQVAREAAKKFNTQVFATTHSFECIKAAHNVFMESERYDFRLHRLEPFKGTVRAVTYDQETLEAAIETGLEVR